MTMCSLWMVEDNSKRIELSRSYDTQCVTFVVPIQTPLTQATLIYLTLDYKVWILLILTFIISTMLLKLVAYIGQKQIEKEYASHYSSMTVAALEMINIITSHGVVKFPTHLPVRILVMSWTFFSLLIVTGYLTGYTSLLTIPRFNKPIDMISDFLEQGITWGEPFKDPIILEYLNATENPQYIELAKRFKVEKSYEDIYKKLGEGKYGKYCKTIGTSYVMGAESYMHLAKQLRVMTQCVFKYYLVFGFEKLSPFRKIFDRQIPRFVESGILNKWFNELILLYSDNRMQYFFDIGEQKIPARPLKFDNIVGALYFLVIGLSLATIAFCGEKIVFMLKIKQMKAIEVTKNKNKDMRIRMLKDRVKVMKTILQNSGQQ